MCMFDSFGISFLIIVLIVTVVFASTNISPPSKLWACVTQSHACYSATACKGIAIGKSISFALFFVERIAIHLVWCCNHSSLLFLFVLFPLLSLSLPLSVSLVDWKFVGEIFSTSTCICETKDDEKQIKRTQRQKTELSVSLWHARMWRTKWYGSMKRRLDIIVMRDRWDANIELIACGGCNAMRNCRYIIGDVDIKTVTENEKRPWTSHASCTTILWLRLWI